MVKVIIKGGVWRNTEDEILKAAVMKYGKNQWARVASLLHRKSSKQCKSRWFEWLDPSIKKTEWSREEDEKLLHLAKLMPTQWRTIAPIVGRTPSQCLERYEYLLDTAQKKLEGDDGPSTAATDDARKLKPGEIDPNPETKPARPDPIDMDEDELEMLSEARARLANTQGKKAKRKAREKQLEEARRLASLQKRRELRAAGIMGRGVGVGFFTGGYGGGGNWRKRKQQIDYNGELPFEKHVPAGFHDPDVDERRAIDDAPFLNKPPTAVDLPKRSRAEALARKDDRKKLKKRRDEEGPDSIFNKGLGPEKKRSKLVLPEPQISDREIEQIVKVGRASDSIREIADTGENNSTATLLTEYNFTPVATGGALAARTPMRTPAHSVDVIAQEAHNILALQQTESSLKGGLNTPLYASDFSSMTPKHAVPSTPNTVLASPHVGAIAAADKTPAGVANSTAAGGFTPGASTPTTGDIAVTSGTPFRDSLNINAATGGNDAGLDATTVRRELVRKGLKSLPRAKNDFELVAPGDTASESGGDTDTDGSMGEWQEDAADVGARAAQQQRQEAHVDWSKQSACVQRHLPRPLVPNTAVLRPSAAMKDITGLQLAEELIKREMVAMMHHDSLANPTMAQTGKPDDGAIGEYRSQAVVPKGHHVANQERLLKYLRAHPIVDIDNDDKAMNHARALLDAEVETVRAGMGHGELSTDAFAQVWNECYEQLLYLPAMQRFTRANMASKKERIESAERQLKLNVDEHMPRMVRRLAKKEKRLKILLGGYQSRALAIEKQISELADQIDQTEMTLAGARGQQYREQLAMNARLQKLRDEVERQRTRENELQKQYDELKLKSNRLRQRAAATQQAAPVIY